MTGSEPIASALNKERKAREALLRDMTDQKKTAREELQEQIDELRDKVLALEEMVLSAKFGPDEEPKPKRGKRAKGGEG